MPGPTPWVGQRFILLDDEVEDTCQEKAALSTEIGSYQLLHRFQFVFSVLRPFNRCHNSWVHASAGRLPCGKQISDDTIDRVFLAFKSRSYATSPENSEESVELILQFRSTGVFARFDILPGEPLHCVMNESAFHRLNLFVRMKARLLLIAPSTGTASMPKQIPGVGDFDDIMHTPTPSLALPDLRR